MRTNKQNKRRCVLLSSGMCDGHPNTKVLPGYTKCKKCLDYQKSRRVKAKKSGMCPGHTKERVIKGKKTCQKCVDARILLIYGLTPSDVKVLSKAQKHKCAICRQSLTEDSHIDHDHDTNRVRGILCKFCNWLIGFAKEDPAILVAASSYLKHGVKR